MEFSSGFLNKLLDSAIRYHKEHSEANLLPEKLPNIDRAIKKFTNALVFEAHMTMQNEISTNELPILHAVNLDGKTPGIISAKSDGDNKFKVHKKSKPKKEKTQEQIEKEMEKAQQRIEEKKLKKQQKDEEKQKMKDEKEDIKNCKSEVTEIKKNIKKAQKVADKFQTKAQNYNNDMIKKDNPSKADKDKAKELNDQANEYVNHYQSLLKQREEKEKNIDHRVNNIREIEEKKKKLRAEKAEARKIAKEEKEKIAKENKEEKEKEIAESIDENDMNIYDELFDLVLEAQKLKEDEVNSNSVVSLDNVKLYESPLPFHRHISSLEECSPNELLIPALLNGEKIKGDAFIKLFHGPPGTGKTYRLMKELKEIVKDDKHKKILVCAPSNIATMNMYYRAKQLKIKCSLVVSSKKMPDEIDDNDIFNDKVIFSTISMRFGSKLRNVVFTTIMMDEAAQCQEAWVWGLLRPELKYIYMAGDPHQLPALVSDEGIEFKHNRSMMERLISLGYPSELLDTQRRMHPDIVKFSNSNYYDDRLETDYKPINDINIKPFEIININGNEERKGTSYINLNEATKVVEIFEELKETFNDVIVISPYQAQCTLLKELSKNIVIHTVDSFQGREADAVILTTVRTDNLGFWFDYRRLNVAMTRAKHVLRIVGNTKSWKSGPLGDLKKYFGNSF